MNSPTDAALELSLVSKRFGRTQALDSVDLTVADGELMALVGPSGCGKSTLLRIVAGIAAADAGQVRIGGQLVDDGNKLADPEHRDVGLVFQEHALFPHMTVGDNIMFGLRSLARADRRQRRDELLEMVGLPGTADRYPHELSGGERQRVALARALAPQPRLMLLDEPFASLDPNLRAQIRHDVVRILHAAGTAAVFVTHDQAEALAVGDRIAVMRGGRLEQVAEPAAVFHRPANRFVAGFMGEANLLTYDTANGTTELGPTAVLGDGPVSGLVVVRPTDVVVHPAGDPDATATAEVVAHEFAGLTRHYVLRLSSGTLLTATQPHTVDLAAGDVIGVSLRPGLYATVPVSDTAADGV